MLNVWHVSWCYSYSFWHWDGTWPLGDESTDTWPKSVSKWSDKGTPENAASPIIMVPMQNLRNLKKISREIKTKLVQFKIINKITGLLQSYSELRVLEMHEWWHKSPKAQDYWTANHENIKLIIGEDVPLSPSLDNLNLSQMLDHLWCIWMYVYDQCDAMFPFIFVLYHICIVSVLKMTINSWPLKKNKIKKWNK